MSAIIREVKFAAKEAPRVFFAPLVGAVQEMRRQIQMLTEARQQRRPKAAQTKTTRSS